MAKGKEATGQEPLMYIGAPCREPFPLSTGNVFTSLPAVLQTAMEQDAAFKALFVPLSQAGPALRAGGKK